MKNTAPNMDYNLYVMWKAMLALLFMFAVFVAPSKLFPAIIRFLACVFIAFRLRAYLRAM